MGVMKQSSPWCPPRGCADLSLKPHFRQTKFYLEAQTVCLETVFWFKSFLRGILNHKFSHHLLEERHPRWVWVCHNHLLPTEEAQWALQAESHQPKRGTQCPWASAASGVKWEYPTSGWLVHLNTSRSMLYSKCGAVNMCPGSHLPTSGYWWCHRSIQGALKDHGTLR